MITVQAAARRMGIDYLDEVVEANLQASLDASISRLHGAVGKDVEEYLPDDPRIDRLLLIYTEEDYDNHAGSAKQDSARNYLREQLELQLLLELRSAKAAAGGAGV